MEMIEIARRMCTAEQVDVLELWVRGVGRRNGARQLGISESAYKRRLARALATVGRERA